MKKYLFLTLILTSALTHASDVSLGDVSARLDSIEKRLNGQDPSGEELVTREEVNTLRNDVKFLTGRVEALERQLQRGQAAPLSTLPAFTPSAKDDDYEKRDSDPNVADVDPNTDDDVADLLKDLEKSAPTPKQAAKELERDKATEEAEKKAPTKTLEKSSVSGSYDEAQEAFRHQDYETAQQMFTAFAKNNPKDSRAKDAQYWALESRLRQAEQDKSKVMAKKSAAELAAYIKTNKDAKKTPLAVFALGRALKLQGDNEKACVAFKRAKTMVAKDSEEAKALDEAIKGCKK